MINPAFIHYPEEAKLLGEMVLGYGELDLQFAMTCSRALRTKYALLDAVNRVRSETSRLDIAHALSMRVISDLGLKTEYHRIHKAMRYCLKVRNQWAHSQWGDFGKRGLAFTRIDGDVFAEPLKPVEWYSITLPLLQKQEAFFEYTRRMLLTVEGNLDPILAHKSPKLAMPPEMHAPNTHNQRLKPDRVRKAKAPQSQP